MSRAVNVRKVQNLYFGELLRHDNERVNGVRRKKIVLKRVLFDQGTNKNF